LQELQETRLKEFTTASQQLADIKNHIYSDLTFSIFEQTYPLINFNRFFSETDYGN
jgi:hypothetical protein